MIAKAVDKLYIVYVTVGYFDNVCIISDRRIYRYLQSYTTPIYQSYLINTVVKVSSQYGWAKSNTSHIL